MKTIATLDRKRFLDSELGPIKAATLKLLAEALEINLATIRAWRAGLSDPTLEQIVIVSSAINQRTREDVRKIALRWLSFFGKTSRSKQACFEIFFHENFEYQHLSKADLLPLMKILVQCNFESLSAQDIEFALEMQEKIGFPLTPEIIIPLLKAKRQAAT